MQSEAGDIAQYILEAPPERQAALTRLLGLCREILVGYEESMFYKMPCFSKDGAVEIAFASQKNYIAFYGLTQAILLSHSELLVGVDRGKGCLRYSKPAKIDFEVLEKLLRASYLQKNNPN